MKKSILVFTALFAFVIINAQSLEEIVRKQALACKEDKYADVRTMKMTGKMNQMGIDMTMEILFKAPNKTKSTIVYNGMQIIQVYDGTKGYMINPMTGSDDPVELPEAQANQLKNNDSFKSQLTKYFKDGKLSLEGEENVNEMPAFKLKTTTEDGTVMNIFVDKSTYLPVKTLITTPQYNLEVFTEFGDVDGFMVPKKATTMANGMQAGVMTIEKIEVGIPIDDSVFLVK